MSTNNGRVFEIFQIVLSVDNEKRQPLLDDLCMGDSELRTKVETCLRESAQDSPEWLKPWIKQISGELLEHSEALPDQVGKYRIIKCLGEGGMGRVYLAEQEHPRRQVALKVIRAGLDGKRILQRFKVERLILSRLDHQCIAQVFDGGTDERGRLFFTMPYVQGMPITDFCAQQKLSLVARLQLFLKVCDGVQHAHSRGIIHRDIKPSNILVEMKDGEPLPKIIDFGIAKLDRDLLRASQTLAAIDMEKTEMGGLVGSLAYVSPEQTLMTQDQVDYRSDLFSLGIIAYQLVTGRYPFPKIESGELGWEEALQIIRHESPQVPSKRIKEWNATDSLADKGLPDPVDKWLTRVRGDLDWIILKALAKEKTRRYASAADFTEDLSRYLNGRPVQAGPNSGVYRLKRWAKRHQALALALAMLFVSICAGLVGTTLGLIKAQRAAERAETTLTFLYDLFRSPNPQVNGAEVKVVDMLDTFSTRAHLEWVGRPEIRSNLQAILASNYLHLGMAEQAQREASLALPYFEAAGNKGRDIQVRLKFYLAKGLTLTGDYQESEKAFLKLLAESARMLGGDHQETYKIRGGYVQLLHLAGKLNEAEQQGMLLLQDSRAVFGMEHSRTYAAMAGLAEILISKAEFPRAELLLKKVLAHPLANDEGELARRSNYLHSLARVLGKQEKWVEAEPICRQSLILHTQLYGENGSPLLPVRNQLILILQKMGHLQEAEPMMTALVAQVTTMVGSSHPNTVIVSNNLARLKERLGKIEEARDLFRDTLANGAESLADDHPVMLQVRGNYAHRLGLDGDLKECLRYYERVLAGCLTSFGESHPQTLICVANYSSFLMESGEKNKAKIIIDRFLPLAVSALGTDSKAVLTMKKVEQRLIESLAPKLSGN